MSNNQLPVIAAIPNYNMAASLERLLPQVIAQGYDAVFVLDDGSTDTSAAVAASFGGQVNFVAGDKNVGAGGNRNRLIPALQRLSMTAIVHFIDADMRLETEHIPELARRIISAEPAGFVAGLIKNEAGRQHTWNFGPRMSVWSAVTSNVQTIVSKVGDRNPAFGRKLRALSGKLIADWPDVFSRPRRRQIFWGTEGNLLIRSDIFAKFGGFDPSLRDHEINELAIRMAAHGLKNYFDPRIVVTHEAASVRGKNRSLQMVSAELQIIHKIGLINWLLPGGKFRPEL